jgi:hypothetical protein
LNYTHFAARGWPARGENFISLEGKIGDRIWQMFRSRVSTNSLAKILMKASPISVVPEAVAGTGAVRRSSMQSMEGAIPSLLA